MGIFLVTDLKVAIVSLMAVVIVLFLLGVILLFVYSKKYRKHLAVTASVLLFNIKIFNTSFDNAQFFITLALLILALVLLGSDIALITYIAKLKKLEPQVSEDTNVEGNTPIIEETTQPEPMEIVEPTNTALSAIAMPNVETQTVEFNKDYLASYIPTCISGIKVKARNNFTNVNKKNNRVLLLPDSYYKKVKGKNKCVGLLYNPVNLNMYFIFRLTPEGYKAFKKEGFILTRSAFPRATKTIKSYRYEIKTDKPDFLNKTINAVEIAFDYMK